MTRFFSFLFTFSFFFYHGNAQDEVVFSSGFENSLASEWDAASSGTGMTAFSITTASKRTDANGFHMNFGASNQKGNLWTTHDLDWEDGATYRISFYYKAIQVGSNSQPNIKVFQSNGTKLEQYNFTLNSTSWVKYSTEFTAGLNDTGGYVLFSMRPNAAANFGEFYFDDFIIEKLVPETGFFADIKTKDVASDSSVEWVQFGPGMSGNNRCFYTHPTDKDTHYTSPNMGNSYRSTDGGFTYETIMNEDSRSYNSGYRGPLEMYSLDFSRQDANYGFSTGKVKGSLYVTTDKGKKWTLLESSAIDNNYLSVVAVDPSDDDIWFLGAGRMRDYARLLYPQSSPKGTHLDPNANGRLWKSTDRGQSWILSNSGINTNAEFETILVDPVDNSIVYAGSNYGFYKSTDGGATWLLKSNGIDNDMIRSMDLHHNTSTDQITIYALSNITWKTKVTGGGNSVENDQGGIFKSTDRGETWTNVTSNLNIDLSVFGSNSDIKKDYYQSIAHYFGLASWTDAQTAYPVLPTTITTRYNNITVDPNDVNNVYLINDYSNASENNFRPGQIWRTTNGGSSWFVTFRNGKNWNNGNDDAYWVTQRNNPMGTNITMKYKGDWVNRDNYERKGCNFARFNADGSVLYTQLAKIGFVSYDKGNTWVDIDDEAADEPGSTLDGWVGAGNSNVPGHGFYQSTLWPGKVFCPSGENSLWITNDEGESVRSGAQGASVMQLVYNNSGVRQEHSVSSIAIHPTNKDTWYATFFRQAGRGKLYKTTDAGDNWASVGTPIPEPWDPAPPGSGDQAVHQVGLMIDKNNPDNMYFCVPKSSLKLEWVGDSAESWGVHKSSNGGVTWSPINTGLPTSLDVARIAFDPNDTNIIYAAVINNGGGLYKSINGGTSWAQVASTSAISGSSGINDIHFDVDGKAYITAGFKNENSDVGGLWVSDDNMATWTKKFDYPWTNRVEVAKYDSKTILLSTLPNSKVGLRNGGMYLSKDAGDTWVKINTGNGQSDRINDIAINYTKIGHYYASTRGSGWYRAIDPSPNTLSVNKVSNQNNISIYPNPVSDILNIKGITGEVSLKIYTIDGKLVTSSKGSSNKGFNISYLNGGIYIYVVSNSDKTKMKSGKIIKN